MSRLRLETRSRSETLIYAGTGEAVELPTYRLYLGLEFVPPGATAGWRPRGRSEPLRKFDAVVDTGATLTNIPYERWEPIASEIHWARTVAASNVVLFGGTALRYRLGRAMLAAVDNDGRWLPPAWTMARCWDYYDDTPPPLLGLTSSFLMSRRRLRHAGTAGDLPRWWLED